MRKPCFKEFEFEESSTDNSWYRIRVFFNGKQVDEFLTPTMKEARDRFDDAGYKPEFRDLRG